MVEWHGSQQWSSAVFDAGDGWVAPWVVQVYTLSHNLMHSALVIAHHRKMKVTLTLWHSEGDQLTATGARIAHPHTLAN